MLHFIKRLALWVLLGAILGPVSGFLLILGFNIFDPSCNTPGDNGGCAMSLVTVPPMLVVPGIVVMVSAGVIRSAFVALRGVDIVSLTVTLWRRARRWPYDD